ncbi:hypothetical protein J685_2669 [Acinetobacter baumannii 541915]|nr:hypothetical protein J685_2669 [Acinetobacter baumannii 541915]
MTSEHKTINFIKAITTDVYNSAYHIHKANLSHRMNPA